MKGGAGVVVGGAVTTETTYGQAASNGISLTAARSDHTHGTPGHDSHLLLSNIGTNAHTTIDSHLDDLTSDPHMGIGNTGTVHYTYDHNAHVLDTLHFDDFGGTSPTPGGTGNLRGLQFSCNADNLYKWLGGSPFVRDMHEWLMVQFYFRITCLTAEEEHEIFAFTDSDALTNSFGFRIAVDASGDALAQGFVNTAGAQVTTDLNDIVVDTTYLFWGMVTGDNEWVATVAGAGGLVDTVPSANYFPAWTSFNSGDAGEYYTLRYPRFIVAISTSVL